MNNDLYKFYKNLDRSFFVKDILKSQAKNDYPLPIGFDQTTSQPSLIYEMVSLLDLNSECNVLEIGTGCGYQTAILAEFSKHVYTIDLYKEFSEKAKEKLELLGYKNISYKIGDASDGWLQKSPFDRIIVSCAPSKIPAELTNQLAVNGIMLLPVGVGSYQYLYKVTKQSDGSILSKSLFPVVFVEFKGKYGW